MLSAKGFKKVYNMAGGIKAWQAKTAFGPQDQGLDLFSGRESPEEILKVAFSLEQGLQDFYVAMGEKAGKGPVGNLFLKLSKIEVKHQESILNAFRDLGYPDISLEDFKGMVEKRALEGGLTTGQYLDLFKPELGSQKEVISLAMSIEAQALDLYQRVGSAISHPASKAVVMGIAKEEKQHLASLGRLMDSL